MTDRDEYQLHKPNPLPAWMRESYSSRAPKQDSFWDHWAVDVIIFVLALVFMLWPIAAYNLCWSPYEKSGAVECRK